MLKQKILPVSSGAEELAGMMINYTQDMNVHNIALDELRDAPPDWNFFKPLPDGKFYELLASIEEKGLLVPLIVWVRQEGYMLLSGHNRLRALKLLYNRTGDEAFRYAACVVYRERDLTEDEARSILVDCHWVQRTLSTAEKARAIYTKYIQLGRRPRGEGRRTYDLVAEHFGLRATQVDQYYKLSQLDPHWLDLLDAGALSIRAAAHLCQLTDEQRAFLRDWPGLTQREILSIDRCLTLSEIRSALTRAEQPMRELRVMVPAEQYDALMARVQEWLEEDHP
jgi:ParB family chromosome partitioning protein